MATINGPVSLKPDANGMVSVYDIPAKAWRDVPHVDAREMIARGTACLADGLVEMVGPAGRVTVHKSEQVSKAGEGYKPLGQLDEDGRGQAEPEPDKNGGDGKGGDKEPEAYNFMKHTVVELKNFAAKAKLKDYGDLNKADLAAALDESGWRPDAAKK